MRKSEDEDDDEYEYDEVNGGHRKKPKMSLLNKKKLHPLELDDLMNCFEK